MKLYQPFQHKLITIDTSVKEESAQDLPLAIWVCAITLLPARTSSRTDSSQSREFWGFLRRDFSRIERALVSCFWDSSSFDQRVHRGIAWLHFLVAWLYASRASLILPAAITLAVRQLQLWLSQSCPIHSVVRVVFKS